MNRENKRYLNIIMVFMVFCLFISVLAYNNGYRQGRYEGMKSICNKDLVEDEDGIIYCDELRTYETQISYKDLSEEEKK